MRGDEFATRRARAQLSIAGKEPARCRRYKTSLVVRQSGLLFLGDGGSRGFDHVETFVELSFGDDERHEDANYVVESAGGDRDEPVFVAKFRDLLGFGVGGFARAGVADEFDGAHAAEATDIADELPLLLPASRALFEMFAERSGAGEEVVFFDGFNRG